VVGYDRGGGPGGEANECKSNKLVLVAPRESSDPPPGLAVLTLREIGCWWVLVLPELTKIMAARY
jgi:hypothetical protein